MIVNVSPLPGDEAPILSPTDRLANAKAGWLLDIERMLLKSVHGLRIA